MKNSFFENRYTIAAFFFLIAILYGTMTHAPQSLPIVALGISGLALLVIAETTTPIAAGATLNFSERKDSWGENLKHAGNTNPPEPQISPAQNAATETPPTATEPEKGLEDVMDATTTLPPFEEFDAPENIAAAYPNHKVASIGDLAPDITFAQKGDHIPHGFDSTTRRIYADIHQFATAAEQTVPAIENKIRSWGHRYEILPSPTANAHAFVIHRDGVPPLRIPHLADSYFLTA